MARLFSFLLLCYLLLVLLGGVVFMLVEQPVEVELRAAAEQLRASFLQENPCVEEGRLRELLDRAQRGEERGRDFSSWLDFVVSTLTTVGSDSYTPTSDEAKLFCMVYCTLGIPLTLFLLTLLSDLLLPVVTLAPLHHLHTYWGLSYVWAAPVHAVLLCALLVGLLFLLPALLLCALEPDWSFLDALFYCFVILSTVGQGGKSPGRSWSPEARRTLELLSTFYLLLGLVLVITFKDTVLQVPQVRAVVRLVSGPQPEEELPYSQSICTISSAPLELVSPASDLHTDST